MLAARGWLLLQATFTCLPVCLAVWRWMGQVDTPTKPELTCWTCPSKGDNIACNIWAPDVPCPRNASVCRTEHRMNVKTGETVYVIKTCAAFSDCDEAHVGCHDSQDGTQRDCIHCCDFPYCNEEVAVNYSHASSLSSLPRAASPAPGPSHLIPIVVTLIALVASLSGP